MKTSVFFVLAGLAFFMFSCNNASNGVNDSKDADLKSATLYALATRADEGSGSRRELVFTGDDIISFNIATREIVFTESTTDKFKMKNGIGRLYELTFYFDDKPLFQPFVVMPTSSNTYNDLVLLMTIPESKFYLEDGYPPVFDSWPDAEELRKAREENAGKRKTEWDVFITYLTDAGKIINQPPTLQEMSAQGADDDPAQGEGDVLIAYKGRHELVGDEPHTIFEIESLKEGEFYMDAWLTSPITAEGFFLEYQLAVNGVRSEFSFKPQIGGWHSLALTDAKGSDDVTLRLQEGTNTLSVIGTKPLFPPVDLIKLSLNPEDRGISDSAYKEFMEKIENNTLFD